MRLIDANALEKEYRRQFESVYKHVRDTVLPQDFYVTRKAAYDKEVVRRDMEAFCKFLQGRPTIDAEPVRHGCEWCNGEYHTELSAHAVRYHTSDKSSVYVLDVNFCPNCGTKMDAKPPEGVET